MKSAYELAMERLAKTEPARKLTEAQKAEIADITNRYEAKIAERQTFLQSKIDAATASGDPGEAEEFSIQLRRDLATLREEMESKKNAVWNS